MLPGGTTCRRPIIAGLVGSLLLMGTQKSTNGEPARQRFFLSILPRLGSPCTLSRTTQTSPTICNGSPSAAVCWLTEAGFPRSMASSGLYFGSGCFSEVWGLGFVFFPLELLKSFG